MRRLVCAFVVHRPPKTGFLVSRPIYDINSLAIYPFHCWIVFFLCVFFISCFQWKSYYYPCFSDTCQTFPWFQWKQNFDCFRDKHFHGFSETYMRFIISQYNIHFNGFIFTYIISVVSVKLMQFPWFQLDLHVHYFHCFSNSEYSMVSALWQVCSFSDITVYVQNFEH